MENFQIEGFHGTDYNNADSIIDNGFKSSEGDGEWLGDGTYFFIRGLNEHPEEQAAEWASLSAWDKDAKKNRYDKYAVLKCTIEADENCFLDLTTSEGIKILDKIQEKIVEKISTLSGKRLSNKSFVDGQLINFARNEMNMRIDVAKGQFYIKLRKEDRIHQVNRRTPNCTICTVYDPKQNVKDVEVFKTGGIET